jgi:pimeloyl-ACP methyl ester carboxylesterase
VNDTQFLILPDKRKLCYAEYGDDAGFPILYCHGFPASRLEAQLAESEARRQGVRIIAIDRPGFGLSDFLPNRSIKAWPEDVKELMKFLNIDKFSVIGVSGGAPYAMSCAVCLNGRVCRLGLVSGLGSLADKSMQDYLRRSFAVIVRLHVLSAAAGRLVTKQLIGRVLKAFPAFAIKVIKSLSAKKDQQMLSDPHIRSCIQASLQEAFYQGSNGPAWEFFLYTKPWQFDLSDISVETYLWHGGNDRTVPLKMAERHAEMIPGARLIVYPDEGHFSVPIRHLGEILHTLHKGLDG